MLRAPRTADDITANWLTEALRLKYPGVEVTSAKLLHTIVGAASKVKIGLEYNEAGRDAGLPATMYAKSGFVSDRGGGSFLGEWDSLMKKLNESEALFYRDYAPSVSINLPTCFLAMTDTNSGQSIILLEDLTISGVKFGSFDKPLDADAMSRVLTLLAKVHACWWGSTSLAKANLKDPMVTAGMLDAFLLKENWEEQMSRPRGKRVPSSFRDHDLVSRAIKKLCSGKFDGPTTLIHGDPHIGNMYFHLNGNPGLLDWQLMYEGSWAHDVSYSICGALTIDDRRLNERALLKHYLEQLRSFGAAAPSFETAWLDYRRNTLFGFLNFLNPGDKVQSEEYNAVVGERNAVAADDLEALDALGIV